MTIEEIEEAKLQEIEYHKKESLENIENEKIEPDNFAVVEEDNKDLVQIEICVNEVNLIHLCILYRVEEVIFSILYKNKIK